MGRFDPLSSSFLGFDQLFRHLDHVLDTAATSANNFPPTNIYRATDENKYIIQLACAGYSRDQINVTYDESSNELMIAGNNVNDKQFHNLNLTVVKRGIATRSFTKSFTLAGIVDITSVTLADGLLTIELVIRDKNKREPLKLEIK